MNTLNLFLVFVWHCYYYHPPHFGHFLCVSVKRERNFWKKPNSLLTARLESTGMKHIKCVFKEDDNFTYMCLEVDNSLTPAETNLHKNNDCNTIVIIVSLKNLVSRHRRAKKYVFKSMFLPSNEQLKMICLRFITTK